MEEKINNVLEEIKKLSLKELISLIETIKKEFNITQDMLTVSSGPANSGSKNIESKEGTDVKTKQSLILKSPGGSKVAVIKLIKEIKKIGLMDAKKIVDSVPVEIANDIKSKIDELVKEFTKVGATVEVK